LQLAISLPEADKDSAIELAEQIRQQIESLAIPHVGEGASGTVTVSIRVASARPVDTAVMEELIVSAGEVIYRAKKEGRNRVVGIFIDAKGQSVIRR
jgi:diguanylate cyclase (GGDEF)-like protein